MSTPTVAEAPRVSLLNLVAVETRRALDTRSSRVLLLTMTGLALTLLAVGVLLGGSDTLGQAVGGVAASYALFLPLIGLMLVTQEWTQRTAYLTFAAVPQRHRVLLAKALAAAGFVVVIMLVSVAVAVGLASVKGWLTGEVLPSSDLGPAVRSVMAAALCSTVLGLAAGAITLSTTTAVLALIFVPFVADVALGFAPAAVAAGLSPSTFSEWVGGEMLAAPAVLVSGLVWYVLPCAAGTVRYLFSDVT